MSSLLISFLLENFIAIRCDPKKHEVYANCSCGPKICSNGTFVVVFCPLCRPGCVCDLGYVRNENGTCIKTETCCTRPNEEYRECGSHCPDRCSENGTIIQSPCDFSCNSNCFCKANYIFNSEGVCIPRKKCKPTC